MNGTTSIHEATAGLRSIFYLITPQEILEKQKDITSQAYLWFIALIVIEFSIGKYRGHKTYRINDTLAGISMGLVSEQTKLWGKALLFYLYETVHHKYGIVVFNDQTSYASFLFAMVMIDFFYYWFHRFCHEVHFAWSQHSVHHSGEDYNLATALRQGAFQWLVSIPIFLPLAIVIPPGPLMGHFFVNALAQFWFHTSQIGTLWFLEYILNTPSAHRMHHRPPGNCNYGGVLIIFDKLFGTYVPEREHLDYYGLAKQYDTFDPVHASVEHIERVVQNVDNGEGSFASLFKRRVKHKYVFDLMALVRPIPKPEKSLWQLPMAPYRPKLDPSIPLSLKIYVVALFVFQLVLFLRQSDEMNNGRLTRSVELFIRQCLSLTAISSVGRLFDGFSKGRSLNMTRALLTPLIISVFLGLEGFDRFFLYASLVDLAWFFSLSVAYVGSKH